MRFVVFPGLLADSNVPPGAIGANGAYVALGAKAGYLADLIVAGHDDIATPPWFVLLPSAFDASLDPALARQWLGPEPDWDAFEQLRPDAAVLQEMADAWRILGAPGALAVRASPVESDSDFGVIYDSFCPVLAAALPDRVADIWRSAFTEEAIDWQHRQGRTGAHIPAIMIQARLNARFCGGALSADPRNGARDEIIISAITGGTDQWQAIEQGEAAANQPDPDFYRFARDGTGITLSPKAVLNADQCCKIIHLVCRLEQFFTLPVDIDWAFQDGVLYLLQVRLLRHLPPEPDDTGLPVTHWHNLADDFPTGWRTASGLYAARLNAGVRLLTGDNLAPFAAIEGMLCASRDTIAPLLNWLDPGRQGVGQAWRRRWRLMRWQWQIPAMLDAWQNALMPWLARAENNPDPADHAAIRDGLRDIAPVAALLPILIMLIPHGAWRQRAVMLERRYLAALVVVHAKNPSSGRLPRGKFRARGNVFMAESYQSIRLRHKSFLSRLLQPVMAVIQE